MRIAVEINQPQYYGGNGLAIREEFQLEAKDFLEICQILGAFHDLAKNIKGRIK